ncbi:MAG: NAD-dependent epimerase/dehydratase family protein [Cryomorphaceae bacterium]
MILVTGATGIVGSHIVLALVQQQEPVRILLRSEEHLWVLADLLEYHGVAAQPEIVIGDIEDPISLNDAFNGCTTCYHAAALVSFNEADERSLAEANTQGTENVVNACLAHGSELCFISSTASIGDPNVEGVRNEECEWGTDKGKAAYTLSKRYAELAVCRGIEEGLTAVIVNPGIVIGPGNWGKSSTSIFLTGINGMSLYPRGSNGFVDARDIAEISLRMMRDPVNYRGQHLLIGENLTFKEMFALLASAGGVRGPRFGVANSLVKPLISILRTLEFFSLNPLKINANSLRSSIAENRYSNKKVLERGFTFRTMQEAIAYTLSLYQRHQND